MKIFLLVISILFLTNCSKPKTVLICGDHVCINKAEAEQYFQDNLSIEVKIINKKVKNEIDLVELNLKNNQNGKKKINISSKKNTNKNLKILYNEEINKIKKNIKNKTKAKRIAKKITKKKQNIIKEKKQNVINETIKMNQKEREFLINKDNKINKEVFDVCAILKNCNIDEISKYLLKEGKKKKFPDITTRQ